EKSWHREFARAWAKWKDRQDKTDEPRRKRLVINDATFEKLQEVLSENVLGLIVIRDELTGVLASFERNGYEGARQFYLTAWNGFSPYSIDRIGRGTIYVPACCLSIFGGIQPMRLKEFLAGLSESGATNDGMIQRFQVLVYPDISSDWKYIDKSPNLVV